MALKAVFFDVGETLVDEERWWRVLAERSGLQPHVVWAALGVTIERGEEHNELWRHLVRGPWGRLQRTPAEATFGLDDLVSVPQALASLL
jgi:FMN phosphatase YigB (HAD superfamily)